MPISQDRMIALISAAQDYQRAIDRMENILSQNLSRISRGELSTEDFLSNLPVLLSSSALLDNLPLSLKTIALEAAHFKRVQQRNLRSAHRQSKKRNPLGNLSPHKTTAPPSLDSNSRISLSRKITQEFLENSSPIGPRLTRGKSPIEKSTLSSEDTQRVNQEVELETAPEGHKGKFSSPTSLTVICQCGFQGNFTPWTDHIQSILAGDSLGPKLSFNDDMDVSDAVASESFKHKD